jgi:hypothetical protein
MKTRGRILYLLICTGVFLAMLSMLSVPANAAGGQSPDKMSVLRDDHEGPPYDIRVGVFVTSIYDMDFVGESYSAVFWIWATYDPVKLGEIVEGEYIFFDRIEIVNAQEKNLSPTEQYLVDNPDGSQYAIAKFSATLNQNWDVRHFPFDRQMLNITIESVGLDCSDIYFVPDLENSLVSNDFRLSGWKISPIQLKGLAYVYPSTFGDPHDVRGVYPRLLVSVPLEREGGRIFITAFLGFFVAYIIIAMLVVLDKEMLSDRLSLIMTALFAAIGNKYTIDFFFPTQVHFSLSDLIQVATFAIVAVGLINTVIIIRLTKLGREELARKVDRWIFVVVTPVYPIIVLMGVYAALKATYSP